MSENFARPGQKEPVAGVKSVIPHPDRNDQTNGQVHEDRPGKGPASSLILPSVWNMPASLRRVIKERMDGGKVMGFGRRLGGGRMRLRLERLYVHSQGGPVVALPFLSGHPRCR